jgi:hypothetical protein
MSLLFSEQCDKCGKRYENWSYTYIKWCESCQINYLKNNFINWTSENEKIDDFIQKKQLEINHYSDVVFEWIPYNQFKVIKEISKNTFATIYSALWKDGPLFYDCIGKRELIRQSNKKVALKCICDSQNTINEFLDEV